MGYNIFFQGIFSSRKFRHFFDNKKCRFFFLMCGSYNFIFLFLYVIIQRKINRHCVSHCHGFTFLFTGFPFWHILNYPQCFIVQGWSYSTNYFCICYQSAF